MLSFQEIARRMDPIRTPTRLRGSITPWLDQNNAKEWLLNDEIVQTVSSLPSRNQIGLWHKMDKGLLQMHRWPKEDDPFKNNAPLSFRSIAKRHEKVQSMTFKFLWYNTWLLRSLVHSKPMLNTRANEIGQAISNGGYAIAGLCEVFSEDEREVLRDVIGSSHGYDWARGPEHTVQLSSGLMTFGIDKVGISARKGKVYEEQGGGVDSYAEKGMLYTELELRPPDSDFRPRIDFFATHLHAEEVDTRRIQVAELIEFIKIHSKPENPTIVAGDFNMDCRDISTDPLYSSEYKTLLTYMSKLDLFDIWLSRGGLSGGTNVGEKPSDNEDYSITCEFDPNTPGSICTDYPKTGLTVHKRIPGKRLDYIFVEEPKKEHSIIIDISRIKRLPFWRGYNSSSTIRHDRLYTNTNISSLGEAFPVNIPNFMSDHLGLEMDLIVTPMSQLA